MKLLKRLLVAALALVVVLGGVLVFRTLGLESRQVDVGPGAAAPPLVVDAEAAAGRLAEALRFPTISSRDPAAFDLAPFEELVAWLQTTFPTVYAAVTIEQRAGPSLLLRWPGTDSTLPGGLFLAHLDVVPVEPGTEDEWTHPPFAGTVADGFIWGRGALDIKSGVLALHEAVALLLTHTIRPTRDLWFAFGHDEEVGGLAGNKVLADWMQEQGHELAFMVDEGGFVLEGAMPELGERPLAMIDIAEKGYTTVHLAARGEGGHSSMPPATTAVGRVARAVARLEANPFPARLDGVVGQQLDHLAPELPFVPRMALANRWLFGPLIAKELSQDPATNAMIRTSTAATIIDGGVAENVVPQQASATVNFRRLPGVTEEAVMAHVRAAIDDPEVEVVMDLSTDPPPPATVDSPWYRAIARSVREEYRDAVVVPALMVAATDSRHYKDFTSDIYRFLALRLPVDDVEGFHGTDERLSVAGYAGGIKILARMMQHMGSDEEDG